MNTDKPTDPADKAQGQDQFQSIHRNGYGSDAFTRTMRVARAGGTLAAGEGQQIIKHFEEILYAEEVRTGGCLVACNDRQYCGCWDRIRELSPA